MPLPSLSGIPRLRSDLKRYVLTDPALQEPIVVWLRAIPGVERDLLNDTVKPFIARYVTGGFMHPTTGEWKETPDEIYDDQGLRIPMTEGLARMLHRYEAMQRPSVGKAAPTGQDIADVEYMALMSVKLDQAWAGLKAAAAIEWAKGESGEAWGRPVSSAKPPSGSSDTGCPTPNHSSSSAQVSPTSAETPSSETASG